MAQTFSDFELIIVDDGSAHPLNVVCDEFKDSRIKYHRNATNFGVARSRNIGIDVAKGDYISFLDSDDMYLPTRLEVLDQRIRNCPTSSIIFHRQNRRLSNCSTVLSPARMPEAQERLDEFILFWGNFIQINSMVVDRELAKQIRFDETCAVHEDTKFVIEAWLARQSFVACEDVLSDYHDYDNATRLSKQGGYELLEPLVELASSRCSQKADVGASAYAIGELNFFHAPFRVLSCIWRAFRGGLPSARCLVYLSRSIFGVSRVNRVIHQVRVHPWIDRHRGRMLKAS